MTKELSFWIITSLLSHWPTQMFYTYLFGGKKKSFIYFRALAGNKSIEWCVENKLCQYEWSHVWKSTELNTDKHKCVSVWGGRGGIGISSVALQHSHCVTAHPVLKWRAGAGDRAGRAQPEKAFTWRVRARCLLWYGAREVDQFLSIKEEWGRKQVIPRYLYGWLSWLGLYLSLCVLYLNRYHFVYAE